ncbi:cysteine hydrolase family protein [Leucobacter chromiireducens]|uniref:cysteine hydrolase family protein n=1 Tax=Leucobacter chromiireducens TaxID=283877 RepID=UPI000F62F057|nr:isochorismatase family cysteine hydrolase [Leucobacter chromiireducens]
MSDSAPLATDAEVNALAEHYYGTLGAWGYAEPLSLDTRDTVLLLVDVQEHLRKPAIVASLTATGLYRPELEPVLDAMEATLERALENVSAVLAKCREVGIRPVHAGIQALLADAADTGALHRAAGMLYPPGSPDSEFLAAAAPLPGEAVLTKTCSGVHVGTHIDQLLRNMGVRNVLVAGFYTDQCVSSSVRDLADLGYQVSLVEDAMGAMSPQRHAHALESIRKLYANSETTAELLVRLEALGEANARRAERGGRHRH